MNLQAILAIFGAMVVLGGVTVIVTNRNSATIIAAIGQLFTGSLRTAMGR